MGVIRSDVATPHLALIRMIRLYSIPRWREINCSWRKRGPLGNDEILLPDDRGEEHVFPFEAFHNGISALACFICAPDNGAKDEGTIQCVR